MTTCGGLSAVIVGVVGKSLVLVASEDQFAEFVAGALPRLLRFGYVLTGDVASAEDLVQTALGRSLRAWRPLNSLTHENHAERIDERDVVWRALSKLPSRQRAVIVLRYYEDLSEHDIADVMGISVGTVKSQSARALRRLADVLAPIEVTRRGD